MNHAVRPEPGRTRRGHLLITRLHKNYQDHAAVAGIDLEVQPGELIALLGPSGCGKTTILRCIAGLVAPTTGDIRIDGNSILAKPVHKRDLGMVFQSYALFPHMTVRQNVEFGLQMRSVAKAELAKRVRDVLELIQMHGFAERVPAQLSGGQQQRIALARAIITNPTVLLLDEPFSALDAKLRQAMQIELRQLQKRVRITTIFVTHDQHEALTLADRIAVMNRGQVEQFDTPQAIYDHPSTLFVADFIGETNKVPGQLLGRENGLSMVRLAGHDGVFHARDNPAVRVGEDVVAALRPEKIELLSPHAAPNRYGGMIEGRVSEVIFAGEKISVFLETACGQINVAAQNRAHDALPQMTPGSAVRLGWNPADMLVFPGAQTG